MTNNRKCEACGIEFKLEERKTIPFFPNLCDECSKKVEC